MLLASVHRPFSVVSVNDPAIDGGSLAGAVARREYVLERDDTKLVYHAGCEPTRFLCRPLTHHARLWVESMPNELLASIAAFRCCLQTISGIDLQWDPEFSPASFAQVGQVLTDSCVARLCDAGLGAVVEEVGLVCRQRAVLLPHQKKAYRLPPGYVLARSEPSGPATTPSSGS